MIAPNILMELHYWPNIQFFSKFFAYEQVIIEQSENYIKGSYRNRCHIATGNGLMRLSVPLQKGKNEQQNIRSVKISDQFSWAPQHWQSIRSAYGKSPFYEYYEAPIAAIYQQQFENLFDLNLAILKTSLDILNIATPFQFTESYLKETPEQLTDFRNANHPKEHRQKEDPHFVPQRYAQVFEERSQFLPNLSILDLIFCTGPSAALIVEQCCQNRP